MNAILKKIEEQLTDKNSKLSKTLSSIKKGNIDSLTQEAENLVSGFKEKMETSNAGKKDVLFEEIKNGLKDIAELLNPNHEEENDNFIPDEEIKEWKNIYGVEEDDDSLEETPKNCIEKADVFVQNFIKDVKEGVEDIKERTVTLKVLFAEKAALKTQSEEIAAKEAALLKERKKLEEKQAQNQKAINKVKFDFS